VSIAIYMACKSSASVNHLYLHIQILSHLHLHVAMEYILHLHEASVNICHIHLDGPMLMFWEVCKCKY